MALRKLSCSFPGATRQPAAHVLRRRGSCTVGWILRRTWINHPPFRLFSASLFFLTHGGHGKGQVHAGTPVLRCLSESSLPICEPARSRFRIHYRRGGRMRVVVG
ncbi:hypothetical protein VE03_01035 [Pseudogymnoascus sp. 23342-1-I1]|nr:hypothetical protein VE03_01035 [Pseudogymnoascus sp. 23342-1-I1]